ncbi:hypothetical protein D1007_21245 [Hordeum vulgare]|nr:hypothetical protein D1007_21245 [Hordeum vulgare]
MNDLPPTCHLLSFSLQVTSMLAMKHTSFLQQFLLLFGLIIATLASSDDQFLFYTYQSHNYLLKDPEKSDDLIVRRLAAVQGYEMVSTDEKDEPFVLDKDECWVMADNQELKAKEDLKHPEEVEDRTGGGNKKLRLSLMLCLINKNMCFSSNLCRTMLMCDYALVGSFWCTPALVELFCCAPVGP